MNKQLGQNILELSNVSKHFKKFDLEDISFSLPAGYIMGYVGRNGAGKTTTINLITHLMNASSGEIRINGRTYREDEISYKEAIGYVGDESYFPGELQVKDIRTILKDFYPTFDGEKFDRLVSEWELPEKKKIQEFSKGMKVKLMFAAVFSRETSLLILDEATSGLDPAIRHEILELLQEYIEDGQRSIFFSTHILDDLDKIADYICFIDEGKKVLCDYKENILENYVVVKGGPEDLTEAVSRDLIGVIQSKISFEGIMKSKKAQLHASEFLANQILVEKTNIDKVILHFIQEAKLKSGVKRLKEAQI